MTKMKFAGGFHDEESTSRSSKVARRSRSFYGIAVCFVLYVVIVVVSLNLGSHTWKIL